MWWRWIKERNPGGSSVSARASDFVWTQRARLLSLSLSHTQNQTHKPVAMSTCQMSKLTNCLLSPTLFHSWCCISLNVSPVASFEVAVFPSTLCSLLVATFYIPFFLTSLSSFFSTFITKFHLLLCLSTDSSSTSTSSTTSYTETDQMEPNQ